MPVLAALAGRGRGPAWIRALAMVPPAWFQAEAAQSRVVPSRTRAVAGARMLPAEAAKPMRARPTAALRTLRAEPALPLAEAHRVRPVDRRRSASITAFSVLTRARKSVSVDSGSPRRPHAWAARRIAIREAVSPRPQAAKWTVPVRRTAERTWRVAARAWK